MQQMNPTLIAPVRDPAPSRTAYRMQRLWLIPTVRRILRVGVPTFIVIYLTAAFIFTPARQQAIADKVGKIRQSIEARPEFTVNRMDVEGASDELVAVISQVASLKFPVTAFDLNLEDLRDRIAQIDAVKSVNIKVNNGGILKISVLEREPVLVWRNAEGLRSLDETGHVVAALKTRDERGDLPLITGKGADLAAKEALELIAAAAPIRNRLRGMIRVGERRWDMVLDRNQRILLPAANPVSALERVIVLNSAQEMLARDLVIVDMRLERRPTIRVAPTGIDALRQIKQQELGD